LELVHHGLSGIVAHSAGAHDVAGAVIVEADDLAVDQLVEAGRLVFCDLLSELGDMHFLEYEVLHPVCGDHSLSRIVGKVV